MKEQEQLLDEARTFCDETTGEVLQRRPEELMSKLRAAQLAKGVPCRRNERTETYATWFVFLSEDIREQVLAKWREANRERRHRPAAAGNVAPKPVAAGAGLKSSGLRKRGLGQFTQQRKSAK